MTRLTVALVVLLALVVLPGAHCNPGAGWDAFKTCEAPTVKNDLPQVLPLVIDILISKGSDVAALAALTGLGIQMGKELVGCAVVAAATALAPVAPSSQPTMVWRPGVADKEVAARGHARATAWLAKQGVTVGGSR